MRRRIFFRDIILGGQDGLVNVLGIVLGVGATQPLHTVLLTGLVATAAESVSMAAVAFTSMDAAASFYKKAPIDYNNPFLDAIMVGLASVIGSLVPLIAFWFGGAVTSVITSAIVLYVVGFIRGSLSKENAVRAGIRLLVIGMLAAGVSFIVGVLVGRS